MDTSPADDYQGFPTSLKKIHRALRTLDLQQPIRHGKDDQKRSAAQKRINTAIDAWKWELAELIDAYFDLECRNSPRYNLRSTVPNKNIIAARQEAERRIVNQIKNEPLARGLAYLRTYNILKGNPVFFFPVDTKNVGGRILATALCELTDEQQEQFRASPKRAAQMKTSFKLPVSLPS
jgi:hypothetical protein